MHDGVATVDEIDDAIRFGAGLRWSFMGTFLTYRIAGGEAGMRHFMAQFGPALQWPWTKLIDVPELTDDLLDRLVAQSDAQAAGRSVRELEAERDDCLVAVLQALRSVGVGAGAVVDRYERTLFGRAEPDEQELRDGQPLTLVERIVPTEWVDYNGHTNDSRYLELSSRAIDAFMRLIGVDEAYLTGGHSYFTVESHLTYLDQSRAGDRVRVELILLSHDEKRFHAFTSIVRREDDESETLIGTVEHLLLHVDTVANRACPPTPRCSTAWPQSGQPTPGSPVRLPPGATSARPADPTRQARRSRRGTRQTAKPAASDPRARGDPPRPEHGLLDLLGRRAGQLGHPGEMHDRGLTRLRDAGVKADSLQGNRLRMGTYRGAAPPRS